MTFISIKYYGLVLYEFFKRIVYAIITLISRNSMKIFRFQLVWNGLTYTIRRYSSTFRYFIFNNIINGHFDHPYQYIPMVIVHYTVRLCFLLILLLLFHFSIINIKCWFIVMTSINTQNRSIFTLCAPCSPNWILPLNAMDAI